MEINCTHCGCNDVNVISEPEIIVIQATASIPGQPWISPGRAECNHCGQSFQWADEESLRPESELHTRTTNRESNG